MQLTEQQKAFFNTFGYLVFPGLLANEIDWITAEFENVFKDNGVNHDPTKRSCLVPFIDQREKFCTLLDHPAINGIAAGLLGDDFNYLGGDGNYYTGDTQWHSDGWHSISKFLKIALYLDPVGADTGALRVIPGSHRVELAGQWDAIKARRAPELWGIEQSQVPAIPLVSQPGDVVAFNHNLMHSAFGGSSRRRMFTLNLSSHAENEAEAKELENFIAGAARFWIEQAHTDVMRSTATPERMRHLQQVIAHEGHLPALAAKARAEMAEPARG